MQSGSRLALMRPLEAAGPPASLTWRTPPPTLFCCLCWNVQLQKIWIAAIQRHACTDATVTCWVSTLPLMRFVLNQSYKSLVGLLCNKWFHFMLFYTTEFFVFVCIIIILFTFWHSFSAIPHISTSSAKLGQCRLYFSYLYISYFFKHTFDQIHYGII